MIKNLFGFEDTPHEDLHSSMKHTGDGAQTKSYINMGEGDTTNTGEDTTHGYGSTTRWYYLKLTFYASRKK